MAPDDRAPVVEEELDDDVMGASGRQSRAAWHAGKMRDGPERQSARKQRPRRSRARGAIDALEPDPRVARRVGARRRWAGGSAKAHAADPMSWRRREGAADPLGWRRRGARGRWTGGGAKAHAANGAVAHVLRENARAEKKRSGR